MTSIHHPYRTVMFGGVIEWKQFRYRADPKLLGEVVRCWDEDGEVWAQLEGNPPLRLVRIRE